MSLPFAERAARRYCLLIAADPDELVWGYHGRDWIKVRRWVWYLGVGIVG